MSSYKEAIRALKVKKVDILEHSLFRRNEIFGT
jgi:hypothetical protein